MQTVAELEQKLAEPSPELVDAVAGLEGNFIVLGAGGKMGPSLCHLLQRAAAAGPDQKKVLAVSRFSRDECRKKLNKWGVETLTADLTQEEDLAALPEYKNVIYMIGHKFGTTGSEHLTWALNSYLPGQVAEKFSSSRIAVFSTGNVYPLTPVVRGGPTEEHPPDPVGEYAQSCLGRERIFTYFSHRNSTPVCLLRLNYAIDIRYGVLLDIGQAVYSGQPVDLNMGHVNVIWQGDANSMAIRSLLHCQNPPFILNITGPELVSVRWAAEYFGSKFGREPVFTGEEQHSALLSNASQAHSLFGYPRVTLQQMMDWTARWIAAGGETLDKPTHFQKRGGKF